VRAALASSRFVHVASHAILNAHQPMFSRVQLARGKARDASDDGRLEVHEIPDLTIRADLVFLSGCETAAAREWSDDPVKGAAHSSLAQVFLVGGARAVIATLWRVNDQRAARMATLFYEHLNGASAAEALTAAQRQMIHEPDSSNPYFWAGYTISGAGGIAAAPQNPKRASVFR
jgi:CHAT domain-containing protein